MGRVTSINSEGEVARLLHALYATAADASRLPDFLADLATSSGSHTSAMQVHDCSHSQGEITLSVGAIGSDEARRYNDDWSGENVWMQRGTGLLIANGAVAGNDIIAANDLVRTSFYQDFLRRLDIHDSFGLLLWRGNVEEVAVMTINRSRRQGLFDDGHRQLFTRLLPHLQNVYAIQRRLSWADQERQGLLAAMDRLHFGVLLLDAAGRVRVVNRVADALLSGRVTVGHRLVEGIGLDAVDHAGLLQAIDQATHPALLQRRRIVLRNVAGQHEFTAVVVPLPAPAFADSGVTSARVAVFLHPLQNNADDGDAVLVELYGLSPVQARLAQLLCAGMDLVECAATLNNSMHTIKSQLKAIYRKTGTRRQAEMVALLGSVLRL